MNMAVALVYLSWYLCRHVSGGLVTLVLHQKVVILLRGCFGGKLALKLLSAP